MKPFKTFLALNSQQPADAQACIALNFELPAVADDQVLPEWLELIPAGRFSGVDGRSWNNASPDAVIRYTRAYGRDIPLDIEHASELKAPKGEDAPAQGWFPIAELENRDGAIWGRLEWLDHGRERVLSKKNRYYSPAFIYDSAGNVLRIKSVGLTNQQNLTQLPALNHETPSNPPQPEGADAMPLPVILCQALGLADTATEQEALQAVNTLKADHQTALNRAQTPDPAQFVPRADHDLALNRAQDAETQLSGYRDREIEAEVDAAIKDGKVAPASKDYHLAVCRDQGGLERFRTFVATAPKVISDQSVKDRKPEAQQGKLDDTELALCRDLGLTAEEFLAAKADTPQA
ncbi:phage protease [Kistimonas scapharcae]|uniref:Phage protease n=1 Tax=Kistimonas scapharcae TaxID=1036133 RepID=A0ABP8V5Z6_9GAMM